MSDQTKPRKRILVAAFVAVVAIAGGATAVVAAVDSDQDVQATIDAVLAGSGCVSPGAAREGLETQLAADGLAGWTIESRADGADCVTAGPIEPERTIVLLPVSGPDVSAAMEQVRVEFMDKCLNEADARAFLSQALESAGVTDFEITTEGPLGYPSGEEDAVMRHLVNGCFIYSGTGHNADGTPLFGINGGADALATPSG
ncbi:MAG: hypothetical protein WEE66_13615 [Actinomycetota bacterium]